MRVYRHSVKSFTWEIDCAPNRNGRYLVYVDVNNGCGGVTFATYNKSNKEWEDFDKYPFSKHDVLKNLKVLAWTILPHPYEKA